MPSIKRALPQRMDRTWSTRLDIAPATSVSIDAHRHGSGHYTSSLPLDDAEIRLTDPTPAAASEVIHTGPNLFICQYKDRQGQTIRGASPPGEPYVSDWLKENQTPTTAAKQIADKIAEAYDNDHLAAGTPGPGWTMTQTSRISPLTWVATIAAMFLIWLVGFWYTLIPGGERRVVSRQ